MNTPLKLSPNSVDVTVQVLFETLIVPSSSANNEAVVISFIREIVSNSGVGSASKRIMIVLQSGAILSYV